MNVLQPAWRPSVNGPDPLRYSYFTGCSDRYVGDNIIEVPAHRIEYGPPNPYKGKLPGGVEIILPPYKHAARPKAQEEVCSPDADGPGAADTGDGAGRASPTAGPPSQDGFQGQAEAEGPCASE